MGRVDIFDSLFSNLEMISECCVGADDVHSLPAMNISGGLTSFNYADGCSWSSW